MSLDARILSEYSEVLRRPKFSFDEDSIASLLDYIAYARHMVASSPLPCSLRTWMTKCSWKLPWQPGVCLVTAIKFTSDSAVSGLS